MSIRSIDTQQSHFTAQGPHGPLIRRPAETPAAPAATGTPETPAVAEPITQQPFVGRQSVNEGLNRIATAVRTADVSMTGIRDYLAAMKTRLETIVKNYPPFPPGSEERVQELKTFAAFRNEIDNLSAPSGKDEAARLTADPAALSGDSSLSVSVDGRVVTIPGQQVHTGPSGLDIPALPETATNAEIGAAILKLHAASARLDSRQAALERDATELFATVKTSDSRMTDTLSGGNPEAASRDIGNALISHQGTGLTQDQPALAALV